MTENDSSSSTSASAPKKLKLTLKLNSSSSSSSSTASQLNSSTPASPVKGSEEISVSTTVNGPVVPLSDLPSGLGNLKGRGRPKKSAAPKSTEPSSKESNTTTTNSSSSTQPSNPTPVATPNEYAADLKSFVSSMNTFKCRNWSLNRPVALDTKNVAGYSVNLSSGLWCTVATELGSAHLRSNDTLVTSTPSTTAVNDSFEVTCQCGKIFNNQSKYKKHLKTHEKVLANEVTQTPAAPTISLKIKLNTAGSHQ